MPAPYAAPGCRPLNCELEPHRQIDRPHMLGDAADGNEIDAGLGYFANAVGGDAAGCFQFHRGACRGACASLSLDSASGPCAGLDRHCGVPDRDGFAHRGRRENYPAWRCRRRLDGLTQLSQVLDLDFDGDLPVAAPGGAALGGCHGMGNRPAAMSVFSLMRIPSNSPMRVIVAAADFHRVFLCRAQARMVLRVSSRRQLVPVSRAAYECAQWLWRTGAAGS